MAKMISIPDAAKALGQTERNLRRLCAAGRIGGAVKDGGEWRIPTTHDTRLHGIEMPEHIGRDKLADVPADKLEAARKRLGLIQAAEGFAAAHIRIGGDRTVAIATFCWENDIKPSSFYRWLKAWRKDGLLGLTDKRGGQFVSDLIHPEAWEWFKSAWLSLSQPSVKLCRQILEHFNHQHGKGWNIPALRTMYELIERWIPLPVRVLHREGQAAYEARCAPYIMTDQDSIEPGQIWIGDHHQLNCMIRHRGQWVRPWITAWADMRSRTIVGHYISASPNQTTIMQAMRGGLDQYGPPETCLVDNGRDYDSEMWTGTTKNRRRLLRKGYIDEPAMMGLYAMMNIAVSFAIPYHPQSKPIERWFDTLDMQFTKAMDTYCGKDSARKPEGLGDYLKTNKAIENALTLETLAPLVDRYIAAYNATAHTGAGMNGRSPNEVMALRVNRRVIDAESLDLICRVWSGELTVGKNGVKFKELWFGQYDTNLLYRQGRKVRVSYDPQDLSSVHVYDATTWHFITIAEQARMIAYGVKADEESLRMAMAEKAKARKLLKRFRSDSRTANMDLTDLVIEAMEAKSRADSGKTETPVLRPVATVLEGQDKTVRKAQIEPKAEARADLDLLKKHPDRRWAAGEWLKIMLADHPDGVETNKLCWAAKRDGFSWTTIVRAKREYGGIQIRHSTKGRPSVWVLDVPSEPVQNDPVRKIKYGQTA